MKSLLLILKLLIAALAASIAMSCSNSDGDGPTDPEPPGTSDSRVWADSAYAVAGNDFRFDVLGTLRSPLLTMDLPVEMSGVGVTIDSVSFVSSFLRKEPMSSQTVVSAGKNGVRVSRSYSTSDYADPDSGILFTVFGEMSHNSGGQLITIDTSQTIGNFELIEPDGTIFTPNFGKGRLEILEQGRVWVDTVEALPGEHVRVDVFGVLEWPLQGVGLPFKVVGLDADVDSVSFVNTLLSNAAVQSDVEVSVLSAQFETVNIVRAYTKSNAVAPGSGKLASLYLSLAEDASSHFILIDTVTFIPSNLWLVDTLGNGSVPTFEPGGIQINAQ